MKDIKLGIIGLGFVGNAVLEGYSKRGFKKIRTYDINKKGNCQSLAELANFTDYIFVCVPTPTESFKQDISAIEEICLELDKHYFKPKVVIIKSTILPIQLLKLKKLIKNYWLATNPEFLSAKTALQDFTGALRRCIKAHRKGMAGF